MLNDVSSKVATYAEAQVGAAYIYGATAERCTLGYRLARAEQYPDYADNIRNACPALSGEGTGCVGCQWNGRLAFDCAQLTRFAARAAGLELPSGATSQWEDGQWIASGMIADLPKDYICMVYRKRSGRMVHTGIYMGNGTVIEARGHADGVIRSDLPEYPWTHWAILQGMPCPEGATLLQAQPILRKGSRGEAVEQLQAALVKAGYHVGDSGVDGIFGKATLTAVMELQRDANLIADGICGEQTWVALQKLKDGDLYTVTISGVNRAVADRIVRDYGGEVTSCE